MFFGDVPSLATLKSTLVAAVRGGHVAHAQLFLGNEGGANLALALAYATYLHCENRGETDACGRCPACTKNAKLIHPDLHFVFPVTTTKKVTKEPLSRDFMPDWRTFTLGNPYASLSDWLGHIGAEGKQPLISVEQAREITGLLSLKAFEAEYKVLLLWLPETLRTEAANALLKILEEPPPRTVFLLVSNRAEALLTTILSRTQLVKVPAFSEDELADALANRTNVSVSTSRQLARLADGSLGEALRLAEAGGESDHFTRFRDWMRLCFNAAFERPGGLASLVGWSEIFSKLNRDEQRNVLAYGLEMLRGTLTWLAAGSEHVRLPAEEVKFVEGFAKVVNEGKVEQLYVHFNDALVHLERNAGARIVALDTSLLVAETLRAG